MRFAIFSLLFVLIISLASAEEFEQFEKRNSCSSYKRDVLGKRNYKKCPCTVAEAVFDGQGGFSGFFGLFQNECGQVKVFGSLFQGVDPNQKLTFAIVDDCGNEIQNLGDLGIKPNGHGGTEPFSQDFNSFNLNCDSNGIKFTKSAVYKKRNCHPTSYHKRQNPGAGGAAMSIRGGSLPATTNINYP